MGLTAQERRILHSINVASENNPHKPEFPPDNPNFPASETYQIEVPGFKDVWLKDESTNLTGTHKDRLAWEMIVTYRDILLAKKDNKVKEKLPQLSIITSGCAGVAIQTLLNRYNLPALKCLVDLNLDKKIVDELERLGCELYFIDLSRRPLSWKEILEYTNNPNGIDVTSADGLDPNTRFYDWMSYEIINQSPDYCFMPFGSGHLYENVLNIAKKEVSTVHHDPRFQGDVQTLKDCHFIGATVNDPKSKADKLYALHRPFMTFEEQWIRVYKQSGFCGDESDVYALQEHYLDQAIALADEQGINAEPSGLAGLGLLLQMREHLPTDKKMLVVNTGKMKHDNDS